jgi:hypothetical protein
MIARCQCGKFWTVQPFRLASELKVVCSHCSPPKVKSK